MAEQADATDFVPRTLVLNTRAPNSETVRVNVG